MKKRDLNIDNIFLILFCVIILGLFIYHIRLLFFDPVKHTVIVPSFITDNYQNFTNGLSSKVSSVVTNVSNLTPSYIKNQITDSVSEAIADKLPNSVKNKINNGICEGTPLTIDNGEIDHSQSPPTDFEITQNLRGIKDDDYVMKIYNRTPDKVYY